MFEFLKRFLGYSTKTESVAPYKVEAPVANVENSDTDAPKWLKDADAADVLAKAPTASKCGCGRSPSGYCCGLHKLSDAAWAAKQAADAPQTIPAPASPVVKVPSKVKKVVKAKPAAITAAPKVKAPAKPKAPKTK